MQTSFKKTKKHYQQGHKAHDMTTRHDAKYYETLMLVTLTKVCMLDTGLQKKPGKQTDEFETGHVLTKPLESKPFVL